jgi:prevent-host-death family protein
MKTLRLAEAKANFSQLIDQVVKRDEHILITRNGRPAAILVSANEYDSLCETAAIRSDRELMAEIRRGLRGLKRGSKTYTLGRCPARQTRSAPRPRRARGQAGGRIQQEPPHDRP